MDGEKGDKTDKQDEKDQSLQRKTGILFEFTTDSVKKSRNGIFNGMIGPHYESPPQALLHFYQVFSSSLFVDLILY